MQLSKIHGPQVKPTIKFLILTGSIGLLTACSQTLNISKLENLITAEFTKQTDLTVQSVTCPSDIEIKAEDTFECEVEAENGSKIKAQVTQKDDKGNVSWEANEGLIKLPPFEKVIKAGMLEQVKADVDVDCGGEFKIAYAGDTFECNVEDEKNKGVVEVTLKDNEGNFKWKLLKN